MRDIQANAQQLTTIMDEYKDKIGNMDMARGIFNEGSSQSTLTGARQEDVERLMGQLADDAGVELRATLDVATPSQEPVKGVVSDEQEAAISERLKALRNAA